MCLTSSEGLQRLRAGRDPLTLALQGIHTPVVTDELEDPAWLAFWFS